MKYFIMEWPDTGTRSHQYLFAKTLLRKENIGKPILRNSLNSAIPVNCFAMALDQISGTWIWVFLDSKKIRTTLWTENVGQL